MGGFVIQHNLSAMNAQRQYGLVAENNSKSAEKLASGYKVNRAADDAAGLAISEKMRRQIRGLRQAEDNIQDGISYVQVADGALNETHDLLQRINELCVKGANDTLTDTDRSYIDAEIQAIKKESQRIFDTTSFNNRYIWNVDIPNPVIVGYEKMKALNVSDSSSNSYYMNASIKDYMPIPNSFKTEADKTNGVKVVWTGFNGTDYSSDYISWNELKESNYDFNIADHLSSYSGDELTAMKSFLDRTIYMDAETTTATVDDYVTALNGAVLSTFYTDYADADFDAPSDTKGVTVTSNINISAKEKSSTATTNAYNFATTNNDSFIEPVTHEETTDGTTTTTNLTQISGNNTTDVTTAKASTDPWVFKFNMSGVGDITATSTGVTFYSYDTRSQNEGVWWDYDRYGNKVVNHKAAQKGGNLAGVMETLTGKLGVLSEKHGGDTNASGGIDIHFNLANDASFSYGDNTYESVGTMVVHIPVTTSDTEDTILEKVNAALNKETIIDLSHDGSDYMHWYSPSETTVNVDVPIYGGKIGLIIQSGSEPGDTITINYDKLNNGVIGINTLKITDSPSARAGIETVKKALTIISEQRSNFGAYQNRLEHAYLNDNNTRINTQDAESQIRDTDMAAEMVRYSLTNILKQAGQSMMAQANQTNQGVMSLLQ